MEFSTSDLILLTNLCFADAAKWDDLSREDLKGDYKAVLRARAQNRRDLGMRFKAEVERRDSSASTAT